jgi:hypothetical protein
MGNIILNERRTWPRRGLMADGVFISRSDRGIVQTSDMTIRTYDMTSYQFDDMDLHSGEFPMLSLSRH